MDVHFKSISYSLYVHSSPEEKFYRSVWKNGIWTHWKSVRKESSKFQELALKGRILTWFIFLTGNRTIGGVVPNSAFFSVLAKKILSDYTFSKDKNWSMKYRLKNKRSREGYSDVISRMVIKLNNKIPLSILIFWDLNHRTLSSKRDMLRSRHWIYLRLYIALRYIYFGTL